jgi:hypothetical protein
MIDDKTYYDIVYSIKKSGNDEYKLMMRDMLGNCAFLVDGYIPYKYRIIKNFSTHDMCNLVNDLFSKLEDKIVIKWRINEAYAKMLIRNIYIDQNKMLKYSFTDIIIRRCLIDEEYEFIKSKIGKVELHKITKNLVDSPEGVWFNEYDPCYKGFESSICKIHADDMDKSKIRANELIELCKKHYDKHS